MPRLVSIENGRATKLSEVKFLDEAALQRLLEESPELIALDEIEPGALPLLPIGREVQLAGQSLDLLYIDAAGRLTAVEAKLRRNPEIRRQVAGQVLEYGASLSKWGAEDVQRQAVRYLTDPRTPESWRALSLAEGLGRLNENSSNEPGLDEGELHSRIADALARNDLRLIIAVDRIVDSLRSLVAFVDASSTFAFYLLEVQEHQTNSLHLASINIYGGPPADAKRATGNGASTRQDWDEEKFLERLEAQTRPLVTGFVQHLYAFIVERAEAVVWGTGVREGSVGFAVRREGEKFTIFSVTTGGKISISMGSLKKRINLEKRSAFLNALRDLGLNAPDHLLERHDAWLTLEVEALAEHTGLDQFKAAVLTLVEQT
jgi:hypothetical protein